MNRDTLYNIFKSPYQSSIWKGFLKELFRDISASYFETPVDLKDESLVKHKDVEHIWEYGDITLSDGRVIKFYEVELKENQQVTKNRVGLRNIVSGEIGFGYIDGAIITYFNKNASDWRFTFISKSLYWDEDNNEVKTETHPKRYTYLLGQNETVKTALNQFEWLFKQIKTRGIDLEDILKAFSVEKLSKEFYDGYFHQYETFVSYIVDNPKAFNHFLNQISASNTLEDKHKKAEHLVSDFVKKFLGRIVFLFFLQKKGWMGVPNNKEWGEGQLDFLFRLFEEFPDKNSFYENALAPLFFRTLNVDRSDNNDIFSVTNTRIPYLNGGLFEKDETEPENIQFEPQRFIDLLAFFSQYNFTVDESSPDDQDIGVDPEMLGHIFENLLEDNKDKGAFYTPKEIVHYMTQESLIEYLNTHLENTSKEDLTVFVKQKEQGKLSENELEEINSLLNKLKILDPAIGSGAFPMGLLHEIFALKGLIAFEQGYEAWSPARVKERIIENSIYGVDIEEGAVDIARLRFWLSLVVDEPTPRPLPNLDYKIICGNSLISRYSLDTPINKVFSEFNKGRDEEHKVDLAKYKALVNDYMHEANHDKKEEFKQLIEDVKNAFKTHFSSKKQNDINKLKQELNSYTLPGLFEHKQTAAEKRRNTKLRKDIAKLEQKKQDNEEAKIFKEAVEWRFEFPNLLDNEGNFEGFDVVIGNPPYGVSIKGEYRDVVVRSIGKLPDYEIYHYFTEKAYSLLKEKGTLSYIIPNTYLFNTFSAKYRLNLLDKWNLVEILDCTKFNIFQSATVRNTINLWNKEQSETIGYRKTKKINSFKSLVKKERTHLNKNELVNLNQNWGLAFTLDESIIQLVSRIKENKNELNDYFEVSQGYIPYRKSDLIKTYGAVEGKEIVKERLWHSETKVSEEYLPEVFGRNLDKYGFVNNKRTSFVKYGKHLACYVDLKFFNQKRILVREITNPSIIATIISDTYVNDPQLISIIPRNEEKLTLDVLWAILNSKLATFFHFNHSPKATKGAFPKILIKDMKEFPIPSGSNVKPIQLFVNYLLNLKEHKQLNEFVPNKHIAETFEEVIDAMVFELYFSKEFEKAGIHFIKYAERDFKSIEGKTPEEQKEIIHNSYQKLREKDNEIRNNLKEMKIELRDLLMPILTV
tara:strand:- start:1943 stop:5392 length:3450 start_codon:yes stop_codon:yes gene_type:complete